MNKYLLMIIASLLIVAGCSKQGFVTRSIASVKEKPKACNDLLKTTIESSKKHHNIKTDKK